MSFTADCFSFSSELFAFSSSQEKYIIDLTDAGSHNFDNVVLVANPCGAVGMPFKDVFDSIQVNGVPFDIDSIEKKYSGLYSDIVEAVKFIDWAFYHCDNPESFKVFKNFIKCYDLPLDIAMNDFEDAYKGDFVDEESFVREYLDNEHDVPDELYSHLDMRAYSRDFFESSSYCYYCGHVFEY